MNLLICKFCAMKMNAGALAKHEPLCMYLYEHIDLLKHQYLMGISIRELSRIHKTNKNNIRHVLSINGIPIRDKSDANKCAHTRFPNSYKHSDATKKIIREKRLTWMKANPEQTAWRVRNLPSYPEKLFIQLCNDNSLASIYDIVREYPVFPHYIDFAFVNAKVAIEIDGSQHWLDQDRILRDNIKDTNLKRHGWRIMRIPEFKLKNSYMQIASDVLNFLSDTNTTEKIYTSDIIEYEYVRQERRLKEKLDTDSRNTQREATINANKAERYKEFCTVYPRWGWARELSEIWEISSQKVGAYCKKHFISNTKGDQNDTNN